MAWTTGRNIASATATQNAAQFTAAFLGGAQIQKILIVATGAAPNTVALNVDGVAVFPARNIVEDGEVVIEFGGNGRLVKALDVTISAGTVNVTLFLA